MACLITAGLGGTDCPPLEIGGVEVDIRVINWDDWVALTKTLSPTNVYTAISGAVVAYLFVAKPQTSLASALITGANTTGAVYYTQNVAWTIPSTEQAAINAHLEFVNSKVVVIIRLRGGIDVNNETRVLVFGAQTGMTLTSENNSGLNIGATQDDVAGVTFSLVSYAPIAANEFDPTVGTKQAALDAITVP